MKYRKKGVTFIAQTNENSTGRSHLHRLNVGVNQQDPSLYNYEKKDSFTRMQHGTGLKLSHHLVPHFKVFINLCIENLMLINGKGFELNIVQYIMRENVVKLLVSMKISP